MHVYSYNPGGNQVPVHHHVLTSKVKLIQGNQHEWDCRNERPKTGFWNEMVERIYGGHKANIHTALSCGIPSGQEQGVPHKKTAEHSSSFASLLF